MAETDRSTAGRDTGEASTRRGEDLNSILQRIADHIAEVERQQVAAPAKPADPPRRGETPKSPAMPSAALDRARDDAELPPPAETVAEATPAAPTRETAKVEAPTSSTAPPAPPIAATVTSEKAAAPPEASLSLEDTAVPAEPPTPSRASVSLARASGAPRKDSEPEMPALRSAADTPAPTATPARTDDIVPAVASRAVPAEPALNDVDSEEPVAVSRSTPSRRPVPGNEPPALRSALATQPASSTLRSNAKPVETPIAPTNAEGVRSTRVAAAPAVEKKAPPATPQPAAERPSEPWDAQSAEALTRVYEASDASLPPLRSMLDLMGGPHHPAAGAKAPPPSDTPASPARTRVVMPSQTTDSALADELAGLARRVEAALDRLAPLSAVEDLSKRFGTLETRIAASLDGLAGAADKADKSGQGVIAAHLDQLTGQMALTEQRLARLDTIEQRLDVLSGKLSDDQIVSLFGSLVPTAEDLAQFAEEAAARSADRALEAFARSPSATPSTSDAPSGKAPGGIELRTLNELLATFMDDRRRNDAGTLEALETLQLAMQHLLDRIDLIEAGRPQSEGRGSIMPPAHAAPTDALGPVADALAETMAPRALRQPTAEPARDRMPDDRLARLDADMGAEPRDLDKPIDAPVWTDRREETQRVRIAAQDALSSVGTPSSPGGHGEHRPAAEEVAPPSLADTPPPALEAPPPLSDRRAFIEQARRAAERAKTEATAKSNEEAKPRTGLRIPVLGAKTEGQSQQVRPAVLIVTGAAVVALAGYLVMAGPGKPLSRYLPWAASHTSIPAAPKERAIPRAAPAKSTAPDIESEAQPPAAPAEGGQRIPAGPRKSSLEPREMEEVGPRLDNAYVQGGPIEQSTAGIAVSGIDRNPSIDAVMRARDRARLASLSQQASEHAAATLAAPASAALAPSEQAPPPATDFGPSAQRRAAPPAGMVTGSVGAAAETPIGQRTLELPPAPIGPLSLRLAAAKGDPSAQFDVAARFAEGKGVGQSFPDAADWYGRAAAQGLSVAQYRLATLYERGLGVGRDLNRARGLYDEAARAGNIKAMHNLAVLQASPASGTPDYATAARLFTEAAERGLADSQFNLAILTESGHGVAKDLVGALKWYMLAAKAGDRDAGRRRDQLIARLPQSAILAANKAVAEWRSKRADPEANDPRLAGNAWKQRGRADRR